MVLEVRRIVLFTRNFAGMTAFYRDVLGLPVKTVETGWIEFDAGGCGIALHNGMSTPGKRPPKIVFFAADVAAARAALVVRGARLGKVHVSPTLQFCDGKDPDGNVYGLSSRT